MIRVGVIGCGGISHGHIQGIQRSPDMTVAALCDIRKERMAEKSAAYGIPSDVHFVDYEQLMDSGLVDAVSIAATNDVHVPIALAAVKRGLPFAVEKPVGNSAAEVTPLHNAVVKSGIKHMVCFSYRFRPAARYARDIIRSGQLGRIYHIDGEYLQGWGLPEYDAPLVWRLRANVAGSGALGDLGCHMLDLMRFMTGSEFVYMSADMDTFVFERRLEDGEGFGQVDVDDYINAHGQMDHHLAAGMRISRFAYARGNYQRVEVYGDKGALTYTLEDEDTLHVNMGNAPTRDAHIFTQVPIPRKYYADQMQSFADIITGKSDGLPANINDGLINARLVDRLLTSAATGARVSMI